MAVCTNGYFSSISSTSCLKLFQTVRSKAYLLYIKNLFFIWSFSTLSRYFSKSWSSLDQQEWWSASIFCCSANSLCEVSDSSLCTFIARRQRACLTIIFWSSFNRTWFGKLQSAMLTHVRGTNGHNRRAKVSPESELFKSSPTPQV